jgi:hypothetical protein
MQDGSRGQVIFAGLVLLFLGATAEKSASRLLANEPAGVALMQVSPPILNFGSVKVGSTSPPMAAKVLNNSSSPANILSISIVGPQASNFAQTNNCGSVLAAGASCTVEVSFKPSATGARAAALKIVDGPPAATQYVGLKGTGI